MAATMSLEPLLTVHQVAEYAHCDHRVIRRAIHQGELEAALIGGRWLIGEQAVEAWVAGRVQRVEVRSRGWREGLRSVDGAGAVDRLKALG